MKRRVIYGSVLTVFGFILSPLSWWNDLLVNIPLAYAGAWVIGRIYEPAFRSSFVILYWVTNILGFFLMHKGLCKITKEDCSNAQYMKKDFLKDLLIAVCYTVFLIILLRYDIIKPIEDYFG